MTSVENKKKTEICKKSTCYHFYIIEGNDNRMSMTKEIVVSAKFLKLISTCLWMNRKVGKNMT